MRLRQPTMILAVALVAASCGGAANSGTSTAAPATTPALPATTMTTTTTTVTTTAAPTTTEAPTAAMCRALEEVVSLSDEFEFTWANTVGDAVFAWQAGELSNAAALLSEIRSVLPDFDELVADLAAAHDDAAAEFGDPFVADTILRLKDGWTVTWPVLRDAISTAETLEELSTTLETAYDEAAIATAVINAEFAALDLDEFTIPNCGFRVSRN